MSGDHRHIEQPGRRGICCVEYAGDLLSQIITHPDRFLADSPESRILKSDATTTVSCITRGGQKWVIKRYNTKNRWHAVRRIVRTSRAANCWDMSLRMRAAGIAVPTPVAFFERRRFGLAGESYFVSEYVEGDPLSRRLERDSSLHENLVHKILALFSAFKTTGICHGDMKATNLLVCRDQIFLIDLDAARAPRTVGSQRRAYQKDRARFLKNWRARPDLFNRFNAAIPE